MATHVKIRTNGQTLTVQASVSYWTTEALAVTASGTNDVESTTTTTITADYDLWFANTATSATITVKQLDGSTLGTYPLNVQLGVGPYTIDPVPNDFQIASDIRTWFNDISVTVGQEVMPRPIAGTTVTQTSQRLNVGFFRARKSETITRVYTETGGTAAGATPSLSRIGLWTATEDGALLALVASTAHSATLWATQNTGYTTDLEASYAMVAGQWYGWGPLCVTAAAAPTLLGGNVGTARTAVRAPELCGFVTSQSDLPASLAANGLTATTTAPYAEFLPAA